MGLLLHLQNIFNMKADAVLNAAEEPGQVFDYSYTKQLAQLQQLHRAIAEVVTNEKHIELLEAQVEEQSNRLQTQAAQALQAGREDLARTALQRKEALSAQIDAYKQQLARRGGGAEGSAARRAVPLAEGDGQGAVPGSPGTGECERGRYWHLQRNDRNEPRHAARPG